MKYVKTAEYFKLPVRDSESIPGLVNTGLNSDGAAMHFT
jgi:hypothetical protein